jgi:4-carboxymuconolactone decarboxylase
MSRLDELDPSALTPEQKQVYDRIAAGPRGRVEGPLRVWIGSPQLAARAQALGEFCRFGSSLPPRLSELAILVTGAWWRAGFEWHVHAPIGIKAGLDPVTVETIRAGGAAEFAAEDERAVYAFCSELLNRKAVSDATFGQAQTLLGAQGVIDLVGVLGYYALISMTIKAFEVAVPEGHSEPFR